jgi:hypothetical protein
MHTASQTRGCSQNRGNSLHCRCNVQAQQAVAVLAAECAAATAAHTSSSNGSGPAAAADVGLLGEASADSIDSHRSGNGSHPPQQATGNSLPVLLCGDMNAEPECSACEVSSACVRSARCLHMLHGMLCDATSTRAHPLLGHELDPYSWTLWVL